MSLETLSPIYMEPVSATTTSPSVELGSRRTDADGNEFIYVFNASNVAVPPGKSFNIPTASSGYSVTVTNTASQIGMYAGGVHHATFATAAYGWIMTRGVCRVAPDTNAASFDAGTYLTVGVDDGYVAFDGTITTGVTNGQLWSDYEGSIGVALTSGVTQADTLSTTLGEARIASKWL